MDKLKSSLLLLLVLFCGNGALAAQEAPYILTKDAFLAVVRAYHPVVKSAALQVAIAEAGILQTRGAFDPAIGATLNNKTLDGKNYYQYFNPQVTIPTWYGLELIGGAEEVRGERVSPEATIGQLTYTGAKLNLTGIWLDTRRAALRQAKTIAQQSVAEQRLAVNNLLYDAVGTYYNWQREWRTLRIMEDALTNARERYRFVRIEYEGGARPAMDTIEALTQLQNLELQQSAARLAYANATLELSNYLWLASGEPVPPNPLLQPTTTLTIAEVPAPDTLVNQALSIHPKLMALRSKVKTLEIERQLKQTYLLPKVSVKGTVLSKGYSLPTEANGAYLSNNNKLAAEVQMPLFFREARGAYRASGLKMEAAGLEIDLAGLTISNKIRAAHNEVIALTEQLTIAQLAMTNYQRLYTGERLKFETGESTLFVLNSRQNKVIDAAQKLVELEAKRQKSEAGLYFAAGMLQ